MACNCQNDRNIGPARLVRGNAPDWQLVKEDKAIIEVKLPEQKKEPESKEPERIIKFL